MKYEFTSAELALSLCLLLPILAASSVNQSEHVESHKSKIHPLIFPPTIVEMTSASHPQTAGQSPFVFGTYLVLLLFSGEYFNVVFSSTNTNES